MHMVSETPALRWGWFGYVGSDELRYGALVSVWVRWVVLGTCLVQVNYRSDFPDPSYMLNSLLFNLIPLAANGYLHYRISTHRALTWPWLMAISAMDVVIVAIGIATTGGLDSNFFVLYFPGLAIFAAVFTSIRLNLVWVTLVSAVYTALIVSVDSGVDVQAGDERELISKIAALYVLSLAVSLISRFERIRRREAVERERQLQLERIELSQTIHDTIAQSTYMIGLGIESALAAEDQSNRAQVARLEATQALSKSTLWDLRHPIDMGLIFEGRELGEVLRSHASTFTTITSIPAEVVESGAEPPLPAVTRGLLFSIAHNAMTNAFRHASASKVTLRLDYGRDSLQMTISDDGAGLPADHSARGHGFKNMTAYAQRMGGELKVDSGNGTAGTTITCVAPYKASGGGN